MVSPTLVAVGISTGSSVALAVMQKQLRDRRDEQTLERMEEIQNRDIVGLSNGEADEENDVRIRKSSSRKTDQEGILEEAGFVFVNLEDDELSLNDDQDDRPRSLQSILSGLGAIELVGNPLPYEGTHHEMVEQAADAFKRLTGGIDELVDHIGWEGSRPNLVAGHIPDVTLPGVTVEVESSRGLTDGHTHKQLTALAGASETLILAVPQESRAEAEKLFGNITNVTSTPWESTAVSGLQGVIPYLSTRVANLHPWILHVVGVVELYQFMHQENSQDEQRLLELAEEHGLEELAMLAILELDAEKQAQRESLSDQITKMLPSRERDEPIEIEIVETNSFDSLN